MRHVLPALLIRPLRRFASEARGTVAIEAVILLPLLFWAYLAMFSFFDMLRQQSLNQKASYTIADLLSRETDFVDEDYISNAHKLYRTMIRSNSSTSLRVSVLKWSEANNRFEVDWSKTRGPQLEMTDGEASGLTDRLPVMPSDERIILVETRNDYKIPFRIGMDDFEMITFTFTRPRFAPQLLFAEQT